MICPRCKTVQPDNAKFCSQCAAPMVQSVIKSKIPTWLAVVLVFVLIVVAIMFNANTPFDQRAPSGTINDKPPAQNPVPASAASPTTAPLDTGSVSAADHELHVLPNFFGRGAVSDGRTYSVALISAYQSKIPPATKLVVQGIIGRQVGSHSLSLVDELDGQKTLVCGMTPEEFQDVTFFFHLGNRAQAMGDYVSASAGVPILENCRFSSPTDRVVRLDEPQPGKPSQTPTQTEATPETAVPGDQSSADNLAAVLKAAEQGDVNAEYKLGMMYHNGEGVPRDDLQATAWWRKAADQGYAPAQNSLGASYYDGRGVPQDYAQAVFWGRKAAEQGYAKAQDNLGVSYFHGQGVNQDYAQAVYWYRKAAEQGYAKAQGHLGVLYYQGQGVPQDYGQAYFWMALAASGKAEGIKPEDVEELRDAAASHLTQGELSQAHERVRKWREEHLPRKDAEDD